jgi:hypothetical protein
MVEAEHGPFFPVPLECAGTLGEQHVSVSVSKDALKADLIREAEKRNIDPTDIEKVSEHTNFVIGTYEEFIRDNDEVSKFLKPLVKDSTKSTIGLVAPKGSGSFDCYFMIDGIIERANKLKIPQEAKQSLVVREIDAVWVHEREHLLQYMPKAGEEKLKKELTKNSKQANLLLGSMFAGAGVLVTGAFLAPPVGTILVISGFGVIIGGGVVSDILSDRADFNSEHEKEAYQTARTLKIDSPFRVTFQ